MFTSTIDGDLDPYLDALARARARVRRVVGPLRRLSRAARTARAFRAWVRSIQVAHEPVPVGDPHRDRAEVHEALALREQVIDFAVEAQGLDAATLQARFRATF